jgi:hypothetical protein
MAGTGKGSGIPEGGFKDRKQLQAWLKDQPRTVASAIAWRTVARMFPLFAGEQSTRHFVAILRSIALSRVAACWPNHHRSFVRSSAFSSYNTAIHISSTVDIAISLVAANSLTAAIDLEDADISNNAAASVGYASGAVLAVKRPTQLSIAWDWSTLDAFLYQLEGIDALNYAPLWFPDIHKAYSSKPVDWVEDAWVQLQRELRHQPRDHQWSVWTDWYDDILHGKPSLTRNLDIEFARLFGHPDAGVEITEDDWEAGPSVVNPKIRQVLDWFEEHGPKTTASSSQQTASQEVAVATIQTKQLPAIRLSVESLKAQVARDLEDHIAAKPNDEDKLSDWQDQHDLLAQVASRLGDIADVIDGSDPTEPRAEAVEGALAGLAQEFENWFVENKPEVVDWVIRLPTSAGMIGLMGLVGANMFIATTAVLAYVGSDKMVRLYKQMASKAEKGED